ncbi:MAG: S8 family serine peptidase, partial [Gaiellaceae bacterium]
GCGTSGSAPVVAGIVAVLRAHAPLASATQIEQALERAATPIGTVRYGRVDAFSALQALGRPPLRVRPVVEGFAGVGRTLRAYTGIWSGAGAAIEYRWLRGSSTVGRDATYTLRRADRGFRLRCVVTARYATDMSTATSAKTERVR